MQKYYSIEGTPLRWHKFNQYVRIPLSVASAIIMLIQIINYTDELIPAYEWINTIDIARLVLMTILCAVTFVGFLSFSKYSWYSLYALNITNVLYYIFGVFVVSKFLPEATGQMAYEFTGVTIVAALESIYYWKRRPLFNGGNKKPDDKPEKPENDDPWKNAF